METSRKARIVPNTFWARVAVSFLISLPREGVSSSGTLNGDDYDDVAEF